MYLYVALYLYVQYILESMCFLCIFGGLFFVYIYKMFYKSHLPHYNKCNEWEKVQAGSNVVAGIAKLEIVIFYMLMKLKNCENNKRRYGDKQYKCIATIVGEH